MSIAICFSFSKKPWVQDQWSYIFSNFGIKSIYERNRESRDAAYYKPTLVKTAKDLPLDQPLVVLSPQNARHISGKISLFDFQHPKDAIYFFGADDINLSEDDLGGRKPDHLVYIPTVNHEMYSFMAAAIVMHDRMLKNGRPDYRWTDEHHDG